MGTRFSIDVLPPLLSGMLWPVWKLNALIWFSHHVMGHFISKTWPAFCIQTCSLSALGIVFFLYFLLVEAAASPLLLTGTIGAMICENSLFTLNDFGLEDMVSIFYSAVTLDVCYICV